MKLSNGALVALIIGVGVIGTIGWVATEYVSNKNLGVDYTSEIKGADKDSQNVLSSYTLKIQEKTQVPEMYTEDLTKILKTQFQGRYGKDGSKASMQWIKEHSIGFDASLYHDLMNTMESGRNEFKLTQTRKIDICKNFEKKMNYVVQGFFMNMAGYHELPVECRVITDSRTEKTFKMGKDQAIKLR